MAVLTIKNLPDDVYQDLKQRAAKHGRSLNKEAILCLENAIRGSIPADTEALLKKVDTLRQSLRGIHLTDADLDAAIRDGRP